MKAPNFYYILKMFCSVFFPSVSEWNESNSNYQTALFGMAMDKVALNQKPSQSNFTNYGLSYNFLINIQKPLVVILIVWICIGGIFMYLEYYEISLM